MSKEMPVVDLNEPINLFENSSVIEDDSGLGLHVPTRLLQTDHLGDWELDVTGAKTAFKEYDDYGSIRTLYNNETKSYRGIWVPHVFAFEATDPLTNLPEIRDRERLAIKVKLTKVEAEEKHPGFRQTGALLETMYGRFGANPEESSYFSYPYGHHLLFQEFVCLDTSHVYNERLELPDIEPPSAIAYLEKIAAEQGQEAAEEAMRGPVPDELRRPDPLPHETREIVQFESAGHFGTVQVPVTDLYDPGLKAHITFDMPSA